MSWNRGALAKHDRPLFLANSECNNLHSNSGRMSEKYLDVALASRDQYSLFRYVHNRTDGTIWPACTSKLIDNIDALHADSMNNSVRYGNKNMGFSDKYQNLRVQSQNTSQMNSIETQTEESSINPNNVPLNASIINAQSTYDIITNDANDSNPFLSPPNHAATHNSIDLVSSIDSIKAFKNIFKDYVLNSQFSGSLDNLSNSFISGTGRRTPDNEISSISQTSQQNFQKNLDTLLEQSSTKNFLNNQNRPGSEISQRFVHPVNSMWGFIKNKYKVKPKRFVSEGTDPMFTINERTSVSNDSYDETAEITPLAVVEPEILGPEACLLNVDFVERFFRMIGCDLDDSNGSTSILQNTRRFNKGVVTFDKSTQTLPYPAAILSTDIMAGPIASAPPLNAADLNLTQPPISPSVNRLGLGIILESKTDQIQCNQLRFICGENLRRDEYLHHFQNIHNDIHPHLNGWFEQRCPYSIYGCDWNKVRLLPNRGEDRVIHDNKLGIFSCKSGRNSCNSETKKEKSNISTTSENLNHLPNFILQKIFNHCDSYTLSQLIKVNKKFKQIITQKLLKFKGSVTREWVKVKNLQTDDTNFTNSQENGNFTDKTGLSVKGMVWRRCQPKWTFSNCSAKMSDWRISDDSLEISNHLANECLFASQAKKTFIEWHPEKVPLCSMVGLEFSEDGSENDQIQNNIQEHIISNREQELERMDVRNEAPQFLRHRAGIERSLDILGNPVFRQANNNPANQNNNIQSQSSTSFNAPRNPMTDSFLEEQLIALGIDDLDPDQFDFDDDF